MFENAGKKIKKVAKGYFITMTIIGILTGIVLFVISFDAHNEEAWGISGLITMVATPFVAWLSALMLYGFGEIVDTAIINRGNSSATSAKKPIQPKISSPATSVKEKFTKDPRDFQSEDYWVCRVCDEKNAKSRTSCWCCDARPGISVSEEDNEPDWICPICEGELTEEGEDFFCPDCQKRFIVKGNGIWKYLKEKK